MPKKTIYAKQYRELVTALKETRKSLGITQAELCLALGWPQQRLACSIRSCVLLLP